MNVSKIEVHQDAGNVYLETNVLFENGHHKRLYFKTEVENIDKIQTDCADAFLVGLLLPAMKIGESLIFNNPISERLLWGIQTYLMPEMCKMNRLLKTITITSKSYIDTNNYVRKKGVVATGVSGGVDCLYSLLKNMEDEDGLFQINTICWFNLYRLYCTENEAIRLFEKGKLEKKRFAESLGLSLISVDSNLWEFYDEFRYVQVHTLFALANVLVFEKHISLYYYSSGYTLSEFRLDFSDTAHYDLFIQAFLRSENFEMIADSNNVCRFDKTKYIVDSPLTREFLDVCNNKVLADKLKLRNCSRCDKCLRTMMTLDILGKLDDFSNLFDLNYYRDNKERFWIEYNYYYIRKVDTFITEIVRQAKQEKYMFPKFLYLKTIKHFIMNQIHKWHKTEKDQYIDEQYKQES